MPSLEDQQAAVARAIAIGRIALGVTFSLTPGLALRAWPGRGAHRDPVTRLLARSVGVRDLAIGIGTLFALNRDASTRGWLEAGALADAGDAVAIGLAFGRLPRRRAALAFLSAAGAALAGKWLVRSMAAGSRWGASSSMPDAQHEVDVVVVGAGPAGAAAAITLARAGRQAMVVDRATFPRDKCCGDGFTALALRELEHLGLKPESVPDWQPVHDCWVRGPSGHTVKFPLPRDKGLFAVCAPRLQIDNALLDVVRETGADVRDGHALSAARTTANGVEVDVDGIGTVAARYVIGADGVWSPLRHALDAHQPGYLGDWHTFRQYFSGVGPAADALWIWFEEDLLPGYAWSFPLPGGRANVGFGIQRDAGVAVRDMKQMWPDILARPQIREVLGEGAVPESPHKAWPIPARVSKMPLTAAGGRALFAGDAACATDPMTGEGIAQALVTGRQAAEAVIEGWEASDAESVGRNYTRAVHREFFADHRFATTLSGALAHRKGVRIALRAAGANSWTRRNFARWLFEDYPRAILATPGRWQRGIFNQPGAYREN